MSLVVYRFSIPKEGNEAKENEDAIGCSIELNRFCVADGATESVFAGRWARLLVDEFVASPETELETDAWLAWLARVQRRWSVDVRADDVPWYAQEKVRQGSFAAFLGLQVRYSDTSESWIWQAVAIGDCCLFHVRMPYLLVRWPVSHTSEFGFHPHLVSSNAALNWRIRKNLKFTSGDFRNGDLLMLTTDALAQWFLAEVENATHPWEMLRSLDGPEGFETLMSLLRESSRMRNDDTTLLMIAETPANIRARDVGGVSVK